MVLIETCVLTIPIHKLFKSLNRKEEAYGKRWFKWFLKALSLRIFYENFEKFNRE